MNLVQKLFGGGKNRAAPLDTIEDARKALAALVSERRENAARNQAALAQRREMLASSATDEEILAIDRQIEALSLADERLDAIEPGLHARLQEFLTAERRELLAELRANWEARAAALDAAMASVIKALADHQEVVCQLDAAGFEVEARNFLVRPPYLASGLAVSAETLELWRRERERMADLNSEKRVKASPRPLAANPIAPQATARPKPIERPDPEYRPHPRRAARKTSEAPSFGFSKILILRDGLEIRGEQLVAGDELIIPSDHAKTLARKGAVEIVASGEIASAAE